jgi:hypothetical protein
MLSQMFSGDDMMWQFTGDKMLWYCCCQETQDAVIDLATKAQQWLSSLHSCRVRVQSLQIV